MNSLNRAFDAQPALEGAPQDALRKAYALSKDGIPTGGSPSTKEVVAKASLKVGANPSFLTRLASFGIRRPRMHDRILLG